MSAHVAVLSAASGRQTQQLRRCTGPALLHQLAGQHYRCSRTLSGSRPRLVVRFSWILRTACRQGRLGQERCEPLKDVGADASA
jgi:hypothetical protein